MKTALRTCACNHAIPLGDGVLFTLNEGKEYITSIEKDGTVTVYTRHWITNVPVSWFKGIKEGPGENWDRPADIEAALKVYREYTRQYSGSSEDTPVHSPFTIWCERQLAGGS